MHTASSSFKMTPTVAFVSGREARRRDAEKESVGGGGRDIGQPAGGEGQGWFESTVFERLFFFSLLDVGVTDSVPSLFFRVLPRKSTNLSSPATASTRRSPRKTGRPTGSLVRSQTAASYHDCSSLLAHIIKSRSIRISILIF